MRPVHIFAVSQTSICVVVSPGKAHKPDKSNSVDIVYNIWLYRCIIFKLSQQFLGKL